jgi:DNA replication and repair protein RecF
MLTTLVLQHIRPYVQSTFSFDPMVTYVVGDNARGKTTIAESIGYLANGESIRTASDEDVISFGEEVGWIKARFSDDIYEVMLLRHSGPSQRFSKRFRINDVPKTRQQFAGNIKAVIFSPESLQMIVLGPSYRRKMLDNVLDGVHREYRYARSQYEKALRQRNALLHRVKETGVRDDAVFDYWDDLLCEHGAVISRIRREFIDACNSMEHILFPVRLSYDDSAMTKERLMQYRSAESGAGVTLIGPQRDDIVFLTETAGAMRSMAEFSSRGQQRLAVLQLTLLSRMYITEKTGKSPIMVFDDVFSELDSLHRVQVQQVSGNAQTIITTTEASHIPQGTHCIQID